MSASGHVFSEADRARIAASVRWFLADVGPLPDGLADALPLFVWDEPRLRAAPAPVHAVPLPTLRRFLDAPVWRAPGGRSFSLRPSEVLARPGAYPRSHARALVADLACPIALICGADGWRLADGYHRLLKAALLGLPSVLARLIPESAIPALLADLATLPPPRGGDRR